MILYGILAAAIVAGDQLVKWWAVKALGPGGSWDVLPGIFSLTYAENQGAAFSILEGKRLFFVGMTVVGSTMKLGLAWDLSDTFNGLMMIPNLIGVLALSGTVVAITKNYLDRRVKGLDIEPMWSAFEEYQKQEEAEAAAEEAAQRGQ